MPIALGEQLRRQTVLVTGGAGFIGCALSQRVAAASGRYVVVDILHPQVHPRQERPGDLHEAAELVVADVTQAATWDALLETVRPDVVVHLAAETGTGQSLTEATRHALVNVVGTTQMLDGFVREDHRPSHIVLTSSRAVYGEGAWRGSDGQVFYPGARTHEQLERAQWDFTDGTPLPARAAQTTPAPTNIYGATKLTQELILGAWSDAMDNALSVLRLQNVYGPGQSLTNSYTGIVALFSRLAKEGKAIPLYEDGNVTRDFVFIDDVADALTAAVAAPPARRRLVDVGSGAVTTIEDMAASVARLYGAPAPEVNGKFRDGDVRHAMCDITDTLADLDWKPQFDLDAGLAGLRTWIDSRL
jgi:dTDP-L-rhamnose 4-epimerase